MGCRKFTVVGLVLLLILGLCGCLQVQSAMKYLVAGFAESPLKTLTDIPLSGRTNRLDYLSQDPLTGYLFIAHLGSSRLQVVDTRSGTYKAEIPDIGGAHGVLVVSEQHRVYASATASHEIVVLDANTFHVLARIPAGEAPDGLAYDPGSHRLFVSNEGGTLESVIDTHSLRRIARIELGGTGGNTRYDPVSGHVFVNIESLDSLAEMDPVSLRVLARHPVPGVGGAHGLLLDSVHRQAYIAGEQGSKLALLDIKTWKLLDLQAVGAFPDVLDLDQQRGLVYVASESGTVSVFKAGQSRLTKLAEGFVAPHAHTLAVDQFSHAIYLPLENSQGKPVLRIATLRVSP